MALVWLFSLVGLLDFVNAFAQGLRSDVAAQYALGPAWFIPTFAVPTFTVVHGLVIWLLLTRSHTYAATQRARAPLRASADIVAVAERSIE